LDGLPIGISFLISVLLLKIVGEFVDNLNEALQGTDIIVEHKGVSFVTGPKKPHDFLRGDESMAKMKITARILSLLQKK